jgi:hypothetical protein
MTHAADHDRKMAAQQALRERIVANDGHPAPADLYEHAKGGTYRVDVVGIKEDTLEPMVGYWSLTYQTFTFRTLDNFLERFRLVRPARRPET